MSLESAAHEPWEQLAVGHGYNALEPADEATFLAHLPGCPICQRRVTETHEVIAALAYLPAQVEPPPALWRTIRAQLDTTAPPVRAATPRPAPAAPPGPVVPRVGGSRQVAGERRHRWGPRALAAAAAVAVLAAGGLAAGIVRVADERNRDRTQLDAITQCVAAQGCRTVPLRPQHGGQGSAVALVRGSSVRLVVNGLPRDDPRNEIYVLWQLRPNGAPPLPVGTFDVTSNGRQIVDAGQLRQPGATAGLAVSRERGRTAPPAPSTPLLTGTVPA